MKKQRVALVGCRNMGRKHLQILRQDFAAKAEIAGILNSTPESSERCAAEFGLPFFRSLDEISAADVDGAVIATPAETHCAVAEPLLKRGIFCLIEKPMASTVAECRRLLAAAAEGKTSMLIGYMENYNPAVRKLFSVLEAPVKSITGIRTSANVNKNRTTRVISEVMIHDLAIVNALISVPLKKIEVSKKNGFSWTENALANLTFENGVKVTLEAVIDSVPVERRMEIKDISGNTYCLRFAECQLIKNGTELCAGGNSLSFELENFLNSVAGREVPAVSGEEGLKNLALCLMLENQCRTKSFFRFFSDRV